MKILTLSLIALSTLAASAFAGDSAPRATLVKSPRPLTYQERYGFPRFTPAELAQRARDDAEYERNGELYEKLDELNDKLDKIQEQIDSEE